ncbi:MAG: Abia family HEPN domain-containing protein, partial [Saccharofermentanales bacterium]
PELYRYYFYNCKKSFLNCFMPAKINKLSEGIAKDNKAHYLYFMYLCEMKRENYMVAFAYFKNFFDRVTADLDFTFNHASKTNKPNYKGFYKENTFISFYSGLDDSKTIIITAHKLRNANPLSHSSSELLDSENTADDLKQSIKDLSSLIYKFVEMQIE